MMPRRFSFLSTAFALITAMLQAHAANAAENPSVIELFTSQGCSSCPPADELLAKLATNPKIIALSMPVDYWDYLGWKDTFAQPVFTQRQRAYSATRGDREVYTPQAVVNGLIHANGASLLDLNAAMSATESDVTVPVVLARDGESVSVSIAAAKGSKGGVILAMPVIGQREVAIGRGENARRKVVYTNIVRGLVPLGSWTGTATTFALPAGVLKDADSVVVIVQSGSEAKPGGIVGAAQLALR